MSVSYTGTGGRWSSSYFFKWILCTRKHNSQRFHICQLRVSYFASLCFVPYVLLQDIVLAVMNIIKRKIEEEYCLDWISAINFHVLIFFLPISIPILYLLTYHINSVSLVPYFILFTFIHMIKTWFWKSFALSTLCGCCWASFPVEHLCYWPAPLPVFIIHLMKNKTPSHTHKLDLFTFPFLTLVWLLIIITYDICSGSDAIADGVCWSIFVSVGLLTPEKHTPSAYILTFFQIFLIDMNIFSSIS